MASASAFSTTGLSISLGKLLNARLTLSLTSLAADSRSLSRLNSIVIELTPSRDVEVRVLIPSIPFKFCSSGSVICVSITSEFAPG